MKNVIIIVVLLAVLGSAVWYLCRAKMRGEKCIGCPYAKQCNSSNCSCTNAEKAE